MKLPARIGRDDPDPRVPVVIFGIGIALLALYLVTIAIGISSENDFFREAWNPYRLLSHGHILGFIRTGPAYTGSLILRAPFALLATAFGAGPHATYIATTIPCVITPALLAGWLSPARSAAPAGSQPDGRERRVWPLDLFMLSPPAWLCINGGHPEDILGAGLCLAAVVLAHRGAARAAGLMLGLALINKSWAAVAAPLVIVLMPADRRLKGLATAVAVAAALLVPVELIRMTSPSGAGSGTGLGGGTGNLFLVPQLWWFFGRNSWVAREAHYLLVTIAWLVTAAWWWLRLHRQHQKPTMEAVLLILSLIFFLRAALDPWDAGYYFTPFMLALMSYEDRRGGFPRLSWGYSIMLLALVPINGILHGLGDNGSAAVFAVWALLTIAFFARRAFSTEPPRLPMSYAAASRSPT